MVSTRSKSLCAECFSRLLKIYIQNVPHTLQKLIGRIFLASLKIYTQNIFAHCKSLWAECFSHLLKIYIQDVPHTLQKLMGRMFLALLKIYIWEGSQMSQELIGLMFLAFFKKLYSECFSHVTKAYVNNVSRLF
jgi:hypothetical protein